LIYNDNINIFYHLPIGKFTHISHFDGDLLVAFLLKCDRQLAIRESSKMSEKLTKRLIDGFVFNPSSSKDIRWDAEISGLGIRLYESGKRSFILSYRQDGTKRLYTIGQYGQITLEQARDLAQKRLGEIADGKDPLLLRKARRKKNDWTVRRAFNDFLSRYAKIHNKHWLETERIFKIDILPSIGNKPIDEVSKDEILKIIDKVVARGSGIMANRTLAAIRKFFNWCTERDLIKFSPAYKISAPCKNKTRDRVLSDDELRDIWRACDTIGYPFGNFVQFLILTAQRRGETSSTRREHFDKEAKLWRLPKENTKSNRLHIVPLQSVAISTLEKSPKLGDYIFTSSGDRPFENMSRGKKELDKEISSIRKAQGKYPLEEWRLHDLRRTAASGMAQLGVSPHIIEKVLNHSSGIISGVAAVYNRYQYTKEIGEALTLWENHIKSIVNNQNTVAQ
jgi:integrase